MLSRRDFKVYLDKKKVYWFDPDGDGFATPDLPRMLISEILGYRVVLINEHSMGNGHFTAQYAIDPNKNRR